MHLRAATGLQYVTRHTLLQYPPRQVVIVEMVYPDITVLASCREAAAIWVESHGIDGAEVAPYAADLLCEDLRQQAKSNSGLPCAAHQCMHTSSLQD